MPLDSSSRKPAPTAALTGSPGTALKKIAVAIALVALFLAGGTTSAADVDGDAPPTPGTPSATPVEPTPTADPSPAAEPTTPGAPVQPPTPTAPTPRQQGVVAPLAVGQADASAPYVRWTAGTGSRLIGAATFSIQRYECTWLILCGWTDSQVVEDCIADTAAGCVGMLDQDPDAGEFTVTKDISSLRTYRVSQHSERYRYDGTGYIGSDLGWRSTSWARDRTANLGLFLQLPAQATVHVNVADMRTGLTDTGLHGTYTRGARFGLFATSTSTTPVTTCEVTTANGQCTFTVDDPGDTRLWVGPIAPAPGSTAAQHLGEPITTLTTGTTGGFTHLTYRFRTPALANNTTHTIPSTSPSAPGWDASSTRLVNRLRNPDLALSCSAGIKVALVMDLSGSIAESGAQGTLHAAARGLVKELQGTGSSMALFSFGTSSPRQHTDNLPDLRSLDDPTQRNQLTAQIDKYRDWTRTNEGTNWDAGLLAASAKAQDYDVILVLTDGSPTFSNTGGSGASHGNGSLTTFRELERAVLSANVIKSKGKRVVAVGIGEEKNLSSSNLAAISGPRGYEPGLSLNDVDYTTAGWADLGTLLKDFARGLSCQAEVVVEKRAGDTVAAAVPAGGWQFSTTSTGAATLTPSPTQTTAVAGAAPGTASWNLAFTDPGAEATVTLTELSTDAAWHLADLACTVNAKPVQVTVAKTVTIPGVGAGDSVRCVFTNIKTSSVLVSKQWVINGIGHAHGEQPDGFEAALTLTGPDGAAPSAQKWGESRTGYRAGERVVISETTVLPADLPGCVLESSLIRAAGTTGAGADVTRGYTATLRAGSNALTITNTVACTTLTLTKQLDHVWGGTSTVSDWVLTSTPRGGAAVVHTSGEPVGVEPGDHLITEALQPEMEQLAAGYEFTHVSCVADGRTLLDGDPGTVGLTVTVPAGSQTACVLTNSDTPGSVQWAKVDEMQRPLAGSVWQLRGPDGDVVEVSERDDASGQFRVQDLAWGRYTLTEQKAPSGYRLAAGSVEFTVGPAADGLSVVFQEPFVNVPYPAVVLPLTGGTARDLFTVAGTALMAGAVLVGVLFRRREASPSSA